MIDYKALGDRELLEAILLAEEKAASHGREAKAAKEELLHRKRNAIADAYRAKDSQFGVIHLVEDGYSLDITTSQKVEWDQGKLAEIEKQIREEWLADPAEYIDKKLTVKESKYKAWPSDLRATFEPARTVKIAVPALSITAIDKE
jgi:hypothetical protein